MLIERSAVMFPFRHYAATGDVVARLDSVDGASVQTTILLGGEHQSREGHIVNGVMCGAVDPHDPRRVFAGTFDRGIYRTLDGGEVWESVGAGMADARVLSIAISPCDRVDGRSVVYAGTEPSMLYRSVDDGDTWQPSPALTELPSVPTWSFPPRPYTHHVRWIGLHPTDPAILYAGIELGGVMVTRDGGGAWEDRKPGSQHDAHAIVTHPAAPDRVYEAAVGGVAFSADAGATWLPVDEGMDRHYTWGLAIDAVDPDLWYVSASHGARTAHRNNGDAQAILYRKRGDAPWEALGGDGSGLERPLPSMPYALVALRDRPNTLIAGLRNGDLLLTDDAGESWRTLHTGLDGLLALSESAL
jgi:photosystem II stability/assembly factor-like uncharacterized protein